MPGTFFASHAALREEISNHLPVLLDRGLTFVVIVENSKGQWFFLDADDQGHAGVLARNWVDTLGARGASCWRLHDDGLHRKPFYTYFEQPDWAE